MGNHHSNEYSSKFKGIDGGGGDVATTPRTSGSRKDKPLSRSASGADIQDSKFPTHLLPIDKLAKILQKRCQQEEHVQGISEIVFSRYVFPRYGVLAEKLYAHFYAQSKTKTSHMTAMAFKQQCERFLTILDDVAIVELYARMYSLAAGDGDASGSTDGEQLDPEALTLLLMTAYRVAMDHYSEGPQMCLQIHATLAAIVDSCFHNKRRISAQYVSNWILTHCPRLLLPLHRYAVHQLTTAHRSLESDEYVGGRQQSSAAGIDLATPVLEQPPPFGVSGTRSASLLPMSRAWLLAGALPPLYSRPREKPSPSSGAPGVGAASIGSGQAAARFLSKLIAAVPSHWVQLYCSQQHGRGANRFLHHVLAYRGPTVSLLAADCGAVYCVAAASEWHESHLYWGAEECAVLRVHPNFCVLERGSKMLFLNTSIRGYPFGLRAGKDPRKPLISIDGGFDKMECQSVPYALSSIEVWGCGDQTQRETQLDIKRWQVKEAERQKCVKLSAADWLDHPDRYLLELAGRPQYNNGQSQPH